ncbi:hypothetical protein B0H14DRAFT_1112922 [Mycena olivaceomarginata]|nr:hypothetical protein B0H14DRAFT_1112922 [Mycena olivaceomarginata]
MYCRILCAWTGLVFHVCGCKEDLNLRPGLALLPPYTKCCTMSPVFHVLQVRKKKSSHEVLHQYYLTILQPHAQAKTE